MPGQTVRYPLILLLACVVADCPRQAAAAPGPVADEICVIANEDVATISLRYRQQINEKIQALVATDLQASSVPQASLSCPFVPEADGALAVPAAPCVYALKSLLR